MLSSPAFAELPLAIFTTLAPIGAGAYLAIAILLFSTTLEYEALRKVDRASVVPLIMTIVGFIASVFHLANPLHGMWAFSRVGHSPLSNEITVGVIFLVIAAVCTILALTGKLSVSARKACAVVVAAAAIVFAVFAGLAYHMETIPTWGSVFVPIQMAGFAIVGGSVFGGALLALVGVGGRRESASAAVPLLVAAIVGAALAAVGVMGQLASAMALENALVSGQTLVAGAAPFSMAGLVLIVLSVVLQWLILRVRADREQAEIVIEESCGSSIGRQGCADEVLIEEIETMPGKETRASCASEGEASDVSRCPARSGECPCARNKTVLAIVAMAVCIVGVFCCRLSFYAVAMSVGLTLF